jgi:hypothetical protein
MDEVDDCPHGFHIHISQQLCGPVRCATCGAVVNAPVNIRGAEPIAKSAIA